MEIKIEKKKGYAAKTVSQKTTFFFTKAVFCKALSYGELHSSSGGLVLKLRTFKGASLSLIFCNS